MKKYSIYLLLLILISNSSIAQETNNTVDNPQQKATYEVKSPTELLNQFSMGTAVGQNANSVPKVGIKTYKFSALLGKSEWDFNLFNSVPTFSVNNKEGKDYMRNDLVRQMGGVVNVSLGKNGFFANGIDSSLKDIKGARYEFRLGGKLLDALNEETNNREFVPVLQSSLDISFMIPLFEKKSRANKAARKRDESIGNLSFRFIGAAMYVSTTEAFNNYYSTRKGVLPVPLVMAGTIDVFFYISNKVYINFGYTFSNQETIQPIPYLSLSYGKQN
jgi:hypothetical protein